jgi:hypothetical protein
MVRQPDATMQPTSQDDQLMSKHRVLGFESQLRPEWRGQDGQNETEQPDHSASLGDSITASTRMRFSVHTASAPSSHDLSLAAFTINIAESNFRHTQAKNLGHKDTRMVEKHYGHLAPSYVADAIRAGAPKFGIKPDTKVTVLR